jgi:hypothetical protein
VTVFLNYFKYCIFWLLYYNFLWLKSEGARVRIRGIRRTDEKKLKAENNVIYFKAVAKY